LVAIRKGEKKPSDYPKVMEKNLVEFVKAKEELAAFDKEHNFKIDDAVVEPEPTAEELQARIIEGALAAASAVYDSLPKGKQALWDQVRLAVHAAILAGDLAGAREILETVPIIYPDMPADRDLFLALFPV
jgi:hypothetical protein